MPAMSKSGICPPWNRRGQSGNTTSQAGSRNRPCPIAKIFRVASDGVEEVFAAQGDDWALDLRDKAAELVNAPAAPASEVANPLAGFTNEELIAELRRRGVAIGR